MKGLITTAVLIFALNIFLAAQGTLQFNSVKLIGSQSSSVPSGKVWKVVSVIASSDLSISQGTGTATNATSIIINGQTSYIHDVATWQGPYSGSDASPQPYGYISSDVTQLPIWLPESTTLQTGSNVNQISVIEFNVIQ